MSSILQTLDYLDYKAKDSPQVWIIKVWPYSQLSGYAVRLKLYKNNYWKTNHLMHQWITFKEIKLWSWLTLRFPNFLFMNESDLRSDVHYLGSSENPQFKYMTFIYS